MLDRVCILYIVFSRDAHSRFCCSIRSRWLPEIRRHSPDTPVILVGTQADLRSDVKVNFSLFVLFLFYRVSFFCQASIT